MSAVEAVLMVAFLLPLLFAISCVREKLRVVEPNTRLAFGAAAFLGSAATFFVMMRLLPKPVSIEGDPFLMIQLMGGASISAGGFLLSVALISSALWQIFKRWKFYRGNGS